MATKLYGYITAVVMKKKYKKPFILITLSGMELHVPACQVEPVENGLRIVGENFEIKLGKDYVESEQNIPIYNGVRKYKKRKSKGQ